MTTTKPRRSAKKNPPVKKAKAKKSAKAKPKPKAKKKVDGGSLVERRAKIRARYDNPVVVYKSDVEPPRAKTRFLRLNRLLGGGIKRGAIVEIYGWEDSAKAQPLDAKILTPDGFKLMGEVKPGDYVVGSDGKPTRVLGVYPQGVKEVFEVEFSDGTSTRCCAEHLWSTRTMWEVERNLPGKVRPLGEIMETLTRGSRPNHSVPLVGAVSYRDQVGDLEISPYLLGLLLGDGCLSKRSPVLSNSEPDLVERALGLLPEGDSGVVYESKTTTNVRINGGATARFLAVSGLNVGSLEKFIPQPYMMASIQDRLNLLRGLIDTDGYVPREGPGVEYSTSSRKLCEDVVELVRSLGGMATWTSRVPTYAYRGEIREGARNYKVSIRFTDETCPVSSAKHLARWRPPELVRHKKIVNVERVGDLLCQCIRVEAEDGLYVTDDFVVTHNTSHSIAFAADIQDQAPEGKKHVVMVNFEMPQDYDWWATLGLDVSDENFTQLRPKTLEEGMADMADLVESGEVCCVIIDSVYAASAKGSAKVMDNWRSTKNKGGTGGGMMVEARQWGAAWTATKGLFVEHDVICLAVNQLREKPDMGGGGGRASWAPPPTTTPRGHALKFYAWVRLELKGMALLDEGGGDDGKKSVRKDVDGRRVRIRIVKNKTSADQRGITYHELIRGFGFDGTSELIQLSLDAGAIKHSGGGHYTCGRHKIHGKAKLRSWVEDNEKVRRVLRTYVEKWLDRQTIDDLDQGEDPPQINFDDEE